jgi:hypothetical protein
VPCEYEYSSSKKYGHCGWDSFPENYFYILISLVYGDLNITE